MELTVLGKYGPYAQPGGATSGYLLESGTSAVVMDLGAGTLARLLARRPPETLDALFLSHLHADHMSDVLTLRYYLSGKPALKVFLPMEKPCPELELLRACPAFELAEIAGLDERVGPFQVRSFAMTHPVPSYALKIREGGRTLLYTSDSTLNDNWAPALEGADVCLMDAANPEGLPGPHIPVREGAGLVARSGAALWLTHFSSADEGPAVRAASEVCPEVLAVEEGRTYRV